MAVFPETSYTLLMKLAVAVTGGCEPEWARFFEMYAPAIRRFAELNDRVHDPDDVVQEVYLQLVKVFRSHSYDAEKARFRTFLAMMIRRQLISMYRKDSVRPCGQPAVSIDDVADELSVSATQGDALDETWARAVREAAVAHVLTKTPLSEQSRGVYRALTEEGASVEDVSRRFGLTRNAVGVIKFRVESRIETVMREMACNGM